MLTKRNVFSCSSSVLYCKFFSDQGDVDDEEDDLDVEGHELFSGLPLNEKTLFAETWFALEDICDKFDGNEHVCDLEEIHSCLHKIELFFANKGKPVEEMEFTDGQKSNFITRYFPCSSVGFAPMSVPPKNSSKRPAKFTS